MEIPLDPAPFSVWSPWLCHSCGSLVLRRERLTKAGCPVTSCLSLNRVLLACTSLFLWPTINTWIFSEVISITPGSWPIMLATKAILQRGHCVIFINLDKVHFRLISRCMSEFPLSQSRLQDFCFLCSIWRLGDRQQAWSSCSASLGRTAACVSWAEPSAGIFQPWAKGWNSTFKKLN